MKTKSFVHGQLPCQKCFRSSALIEWNCANYEEFYKDRNAWRLRRNPGYWGALEPEILVLGFSKGPSQNDLISKDVRFEDIPFNDESGRMRQNLASMLKKVGLMKDSEKLHELFDCKEEKFGFASLVRCSVEYLKGSEWIGTDGNIMTKTLSVQPEFVTNCIKEHLSDLPTSLKVIVVLGMGRKYIPKVRDLLGAKRDRQNFYTYWLGDILCVHIPHPSPGNAGPIYVFRNQVCARTPSEKNVPQCLKEVKTCVENIGL